MNVIITGVGRKTGIGAAIAYELAQKGYNLYLTSCMGYDITHGICKEQIQDIPEEYLETQKKCEACGVKVVFKSFDLTHQNAYKELFNDAVNQIGDIQVLVTSHCIHEFDELGTITRRQLHRNFKVNAEATFFLVQEFYRRFHGSCGSVVVLSSTQGLEPLITEVSYAISKASIPILVSTTAPILAKKGIRINAVNPGATAIEDVNDDIEKYRQNNLFRRAGKPSDTAHLVSFLVSNEGQWITGQTINSEGCLFRGVTSFPYY